jgi:hypothetical protein
MSAPLVPKGKVQWTDENGFPLVGGTVQFCIPGTSTPKDTWEDAAQTTANQNPLTLDDRGEAVIFGTGTYRQIVYDAIGNLIYDVLTYCGLDASAVSFDNATLDQIFLNRLNRVVDSIDGLRALSKTTYTRAFVTGYYGTHDGGGGAYQFDPSDTSSVDNGGTIIVAADGGRWKMQVMGVLSIKQFGAPCDGTNSDYQYIANHLAWLSSIGGGTALVPDGADVTLAANQVLSIPEGCFLSGSHPIDVKETDVTTMLARGPRITLDPTATISPSSTAGVTKLLILQKNIRFNVGSSERAGFFLGTAITIPDQTYGQTIEDVGAFGFLNAIATPNTATSVERVHVRRLLHDCQNGVYLRNQFDIGICTEVWGRPFCSFNVTPPETNDAHLKRDGSNVWFDVVSAYSEMNDCFAFGWQSTYRISGSGNGGVTLTNPGADGPGGVADGSMGIDVHDSTYEITVVNPKISGKDTGISMNSQDPNGRLLVTGGHLFECFSNGVVNMMGEVYLTGTDLRNSGNQGTPTGNGVYATDTSTATRLSNCNVEGFAIALKTDSSGVNIMFDTNTRFERNTTIANNPYQPGVVSANALPIDGEAMMYHVAGGADIISIAHPERYTQRPLILKFDAPLTIHATGGNLVLNGGANFVTSAGSILMLASNDGVTFYEISRHA